MAGRGPAPKDPSQRRRTNAPEPLELVQSDGKTHGKPLPETHEWPKATLDWWETWRTCPQASKFTATDWSFMLDTAILHAEFWLGDKTVAAELRLRVAKFGATPEDRARLKIAVAVAGVQPAESPVRLQTKASQSRRERLLRAVGDGGGES